MRIGASLVLIAIGAILKWAVTQSVNGVNLGTVGVILMIVGALGLIITLIWMSTRRRTDVMYHGPAGTRGATYVQPHDPVEGPY
jgi:hypothetical protein